MESPQLQIGFLMDTVSIYSILLSTIFLFLFLCILPSLLHIGLAYCLFLSLSYTINLFLAIFRNTAAKFLLYSRQQSIIYIYVYIYVYIYII